MTSTLAVGSTVGAAWSLSWRTAAARAGPGRAGLGGIMSAV